MHLKTDYNARRSSISISHTSKILSIGSCFSSHLAENLKNLKFQIYNNPYGTLYNPISILESLIYTQDSFIDSLIQRDGKWVSFNAHSDISEFQKDQLNERLKEIARDIESKLKKIDVLILTFGNTKVYRHPSQKTVVANCHKLPNNDFESYYLDKDEIIDKFNSVYKTLSTINPSLRIILTVSPVRYLSDGFEMNSLSKSTLILACHEISKTNNFVEYFPSYEIIIDDLRDYRFFEADLIHPNKIAIQYVLEAFQKCYFTESTLEINKQILGINQALGHKPFNIKSEKYLEMVKSLQKKISELPDYIDSNEWRKQIKNISQAI